MEAAKSLGNSLSRNRELLHLDLSGNTLAEHDRGQQLLDSLPSQEELNLATLDIRRTGASPQVLQEVRSRVRPRLTELEEARRARLNQGGWDQAL